MGSKAICSSKAHQHIPAAVTAIVSVTTTTKGSVYVCTSLVQTGFRADEIQSWKGVFIMATSESIIILTLVLVYCMLFHFKNDLYIYIYNSFMEL